MVSLSIRLREPITSQSGYSPKPVDNTASTAIAKLAVQEVGSKERKTKRKAAKGAGVGGEYSPYRADQEEVRPGTWNLRLAKKESDPGLEVA